MRAEIEQAVKLLRQNDPKSLDAALALLQGTIFSFSMKVCGQRQDAEDTAQEVLLNSVGRLGAFDSAKALSVWLYKVAKTRCLMSRRKSKFAPKQVLSLENLMPDRKELDRLAGKAEVTPESAVLRSENQRRVREAVQTLPPDYRLILVLHDMENLSDDEIAKITGLRAGTVRVQLHRARLFVRKQLSSSSPAPPPSGKKTRLVARPMPRARRCKELFAELSNYLDDSLDDALCSELEKHLDGCEPCKAFLSNLEESIEQCRHVPNDRPDQARAAQVRRQILDAYQNAMATVRRPASR